MSLPTATTPDPPPAMTDVTVASHTEPSTSHTLDDTVPTPRSNGYDYGGKLINFDLFSSVAKHLNNVDAHSLRLTCRSFCHAMDKVIFEETAVSLELHTPHVGCVARRVPMIAPIDGGRYNYTPRIPKGTGNAEFAEALATHIEKTKRHIRGLRVLHIWGIPGDQKILQALIDPNTLPLEEVVLWPTADESGGNADGYMADLSWLFPANSEKPAPRLTINCDLGALRNINGEVPFLLGNSPIAIPPGVTSLVVNVLRPREDLQVDWVFPHITFDQGSEASVEIVFSAATDTPTRARSAVEDSVMKALGSNRRRPGENNSCRDRWLMATLMPVAVQGLTRVRIHGLRNYFHPLLSHAQVQVYVIKLSYRIALRLLHLSPAALLRYAPASLLLHIQGKTRKELVQRVADFFVEQ